jgi:DNA polymerase-1
MGDGPVPCRIMLVGEAPGFREDEISKPFAGAAGQYLDRILEEVGLPRASVYITNANKCRPPDNRTPTKTEIRACHPYLEMELATVQPEFVVPLGNAALEAVLGKKGIMKLRGAIVEKDGYKVIPTLHPAAILRNPAWEPLFKADLQTLARAVSGIETRPETKSWIIKSEKSLRAFLKKIVAVDTPIALDLETWSPDQEGGLSPWHPQGIILTCSFTWAVGESYVIALEHPEQEWDIPVSTVYQALNVALEGKRMIGHNVKFDMKWMRSKGVNLTASFDTLLAAHLLDENRPNGLKSLSRLFLGAEEYEANIDFRTPHPLGPLAIYNGKDTDYTFRLYLIFRQALKQRPKVLRLFKLLVMPAANAFTEVEGYGFPVDIKRLKQRNIEILENIDLVNEKLRTYIPEDIRPPTTNFRSPIFLSWYFFELLELPILVITPKSGRPSTAESVLLKLKNKHPSVGLLMELRKWMKYESTYTRNWLRRVRSAGRSRVYTSYNISGTVTGRLSSDMQQVPRDLFIRSIIGFSDSYNGKRSSLDKPAHRFVEADFSQIELRIAAMFSRDPALTKAFRTGGDPHRETAAAVTGKDLATITKEERKMAKAVNFGFLYGMGAKKFRVYADEKYQIKITEQEAADYRKKFFNQYHGLLPWHDRQRRLVRNLGHVTSPIGRIRHLPTIQSSDEGIQAQAEREAINSPVQGLASDLTVLSMVLLHGRLDRHRGRIIGNVHDAILFQLDDDYITEASALIKETMENLPLKKYFGWKPTVPIEVEISVSNHWGESAKEA